MIGVSYHPKVVDYKDNKLMNEIRNLNWCRPPSGIPGNWTPRYVAVMGDGSSVDNMGNLIDTSISSIMNTSYPLYQCNKKSYGIYNMIPITYNLRKLIVKMRNIVMKQYGSSVKNVNSMFNVIVCNYYTQNSHQINAHKDDERWLVKNIETNGEKSSLIASVTLYPDDDEPEIYRNFEIKNKDTWINYQLENGSVIFFSNQIHRAKPLGKKKKISKELI